MPVGYGSRVTAVSWRSVRVTPVLFSIPLGFAALAGLWRLGADNIGAPLGVADAVAVIGGAVWLSLAGEWIGDLVRARTRLLAQMSDPTSGPAVAVLPISAVSLSLALDPYAVGASRIVFVVAGVTTLATDLLLAWIWIDRIELDQLHPGYFLPSVAGQSLTGQGCVTFGWQLPAEILLGVSWAAWIVLGALICVRLTDIPLPFSLTPALAIWIAAPALVSNTYLDVVSRFDVWAWLLLIVMLAMAVLEVWCIPMYRRIRFGPGVWGFSFVCSTVAVTALRWIDHLAGDRAQALQWLAIAAGSIIPAILTVKTIRAIARDEFFERWPDGGGVAGDGR
jgi:tellurite resistance protein